MKTRNRRSKEEIKAACEAVRGEVLAGSTLSAALKKHNLFSATYYSFYGKKKGTKVKKPKKQKADATPSLDAFQAQLNQAVVYHKDFVIVCSPADVLKIMAGI